MASQSALIKDTFYCRCAKEFEVKSSAKIKKKKRRECETATDRNCNLTVNRGFQEDDEIQPNTKNRSSLTSFMEIDDLQSNSCRRSTKKETDAEVTKSKRFKRGNFHSTGQGKSCVVEVREEQMIQQNSSCVNEDPRTRKVSLVSSMINDLQREDTITEKTETSTFQRGGTSQQWDSSIEAEDLSELEKNERRETTKDETGEHIQNGEKEKVSLLSRLKSKLTKRKILAVMCPCFTYLILKGESKEKVANDEMRQDDMHRQVMR